MTDSPTATEDDEATVRQAVGYRARGPAGHAWGAPSPPRAPMAYAAADGSIHRAPQPLVNYDSVDPAVHKAHASRRRRRRPLPTQTVMAGEESLHKHIDGAPPPPPPPPTSTSHPTFPPSNPSLHLDGDVQLWESKLADQAARIAALQDKFTGAVMPPPPPAAPSEPAAPAAPPAEAPAPEAPPAEAPKPRRRGPPKPWSDDARRHGKPRYGHTLGGSKRPQGGPPWTEGMGNPAEPGNPPKETSGTCLPWTRTRRRRRRRACRCRRRSRAPSNSRPNGRWRRWRPRSPRRRRRRRYRRCRSPNWKSRFNWPRRSFAAWRCH